MKSLLRLLAGAWLAVTLAASAHAAVIFDNLLPGGGFNDGVGYAIDNSTFQGDQWSAGASGNLTDLYLGIAAQSGRTGNLILLLFADAGNSPGQLLDIFEVANADVPTPGSGNLLHVEAAGATSLVAGNAYWLLAGAYGDGLFAWGENFLEPRDMGLHLNLCPFPVCIPEQLFFSEAIGSSLRVESNVAGPGPGAVPEPVSLALLGIGLAGLGWSRRRARS